MVCGGHRVDIRCAKAVTRRAAQQGIRVTWMHFEAMPHCFPALPVFDHSRQGMLCMKLWAEFWKECVEGVNTGKSDIDEGGFQGC